MHGAKIFGTHCATFSVPGLRYRQQDLRHLLQLLCHQVHPGGNQEGPQAAPGLHWFLQT